MKNFLSQAASLIFLLSGCAQAASDADVTLLKVRKVTIEKSVITIVVEEAKTRITLIKGDHDPAYKGDTWHGMPVTSVQVISNEATFTIKQPDYAGPRGPLASVWEESLKAARELQDGKQTGGIGFYTPDIVIKGNMITSITGGGFLHSTTKNDSAPFPPPLPKEDPQSRIIGKIIEKTAEGILVECTSAPGTDNRAQGIVFLKGHPDFTKLSKGAAIECLATQAGTYNYPTPENAKGTLVAFTYDPP